MRLLLRWLSVVVLVSGCSQSGMPVSPTTAPSQPPAPAQRGPDEGNWSPYFFKGWRPGIGEPLSPGVTVNSVVQADDVCVADLRWSWDARSSCKRFVVSVPVAGTLETFLHWDASAPGFDINLAGDVVLVKPSGQFADSDWLQTDVHVAVRVEPGDYGVLVMTYVPASLPFQIRTELTPN
jgi:hypothetical protein